MKLLGKIGLSIAVLFILVMFSACGTVEYSVKDFADVTVIGYTEHGTLSIKASFPSVSGWRIPNELLLNLTGST